MTEEHSSPIKTPKQLVIVVLLAFAVPITLAVMISQLVTSGEKGDAQNDNLVLQRIQPVGTVVLAEATGPKGMLTGEQVYGQVCKTCHETGLAGSPKLGDKAAWAKIVAQGDKLTFEHAIGGIRAMPAEGRQQRIDRRRSEARRRLHGEQGRRHLDGAGGGGRRGRTRRRGGAGRRRATHGPAGRRSDVRQVPHRRRGRRAEDRRPRRVDQPREARSEQGVRIGAEGPRGHARARRHGRPLGRRSEARRRIHDEQRGRHAGRRRAPAAAVAAAPAAAPAADAGKKVYDSGCVACHGAGIAGAPKFGDKAAWAPRIKTGMDALYAASLKGKGVMPPKGGNVALSDADVKAAVDYMVAASR